ncbi:nucleotidyltransferase [Geomonas sp. RF6]|uniref:nucleotidyltransferase n=1 Tax=Geomonas sp. RF6 TaxID=2897342 RepID=UPI001E3191A6|nr:nucleotidyltransferase [Geomonas sp. RF6]UFS71722.1 nucleotidyltransferase [Geomonas sp. RF6]
MTDLIPPEQWTVYSEFLTEIMERRIPFAVGGGLAISAYTGCVRNTKDMDIFVLEKDSEEVVDITRRLRFDEFTEVPYDRTWSYRSSRDGYIMDFLWKMLNERAPVTEDWLTRGWELQVRGVPLRLLPVEELIWSKLYILRIDRADWPDILSLLYARGVELDWEHMLSNLGDDAMVLGGVVNLLRWLCPGLACRFPESIWAPMGLLPPPFSDAEVHHERVALFKSAHLFAGDLP